MAKLYEFTCEYCGMKFQRTQGQVTSATNRGSKIKYCSRKCKVKAETSDTKEVQCAQCSKPFNLPKNRLDRADKYFCSKECKDAYGNKDRFLGYEDKICKRCGKTFKIKVSDINKYKGIRTFEYCSTACVAGERTTTKCDYCGKELTMGKFDFDASQKHYCDTKCAAANKSTSVEVKCSYCGKAFMAEPARIGYYNHLYCSNDCRLKDFLSYSEYNFSIAEFGVYKELSQRLRTCRTYRAWRKQILNLRGNRCEACSSERSLQIHHSKYSMYQICKENSYDYNKVLSDQRFTDQENGIILCKKCHMNHHFC